MNTIWFKKMGIIYIPTSLIGIVMYLMTIIFCTTVVLAANRHAHSMSDFLYSIFPYFVSSFTILFWIAGNTCQTKEN